MMEPSEEILKALDEIVDVNLEEVGRRRVGKRSSILKQPRLDDDQTEDLQKRKSLTSKRRVSFADKFQVMEICTGNVYDIPGRSISASDSILSGDSKSVPEPETSKKDAVDFHISRNEIKASTITEVVLTKSENKSLSFSKKHKISLDKNAEPESKKINIEETNTSPLNLEDSIFNHQEKLMSECKNFLFGSADIVNEVKDQSVELTSVENAVTSTSGTHDALQLKGSEEKLCDLTCSEILSQTKSDYVPIPESVTYKSASISKCMVNDYDLRNKLNFENKNSYDLENQMDPKRWSSKVEVLPISLSDVPLEENKENIFVDVKNKKVLVTNARDLKLKEKLPLKLSQVSKHPGTQIEKINSFSVSKVLQSKENFHPISMKDITNKQNEKSFVNKTCILNPSMELTCFPSYMDLTKKLEHLRNDDYTKNDEHQLNKTCMDTSDFMDLTCNVQNLTDCLSSAVSKACEEKKQYITNMDVEFAKKSSDKHASIDTCNANNLSDNLLITVETDNTKELSTQYTDSSCDKIRENVSVNRCSQTKYFSSCGMELTCDVKDNTNLKICDMDLTKKLEHTTKSVCIENDEHQSNKTCIDTSHFMDLTCNVQNLTDSLSFAISNVCDEKKQYITNLGIEFAEKNFDKNVSGTENAMNITGCADNINSSDNLIISRETDNMKELSTQYTDFSEKRNRYSQTKYFSYCGMELTCNAKDNTNLKINDHASDHPDESQPAKSFFSNNAKSELDEGVNQYKGIFENSSVHPCAETVDLVLLEPGEEDFNSVQDNEETRFMCDEMELTCYDKNISHEVDDAPMICASNMSAKDSQASNSKIIEEDYDMNYKSVVSNKTQHFTSNYMELTSRTCSEETNISAKDSQASNSKLIEEDYDMNYKSLVSNKTQHFTSNYMELTSRTCSGETNISAKDSQASNSKLIEEDYDMNYKSLVSNKTQHFTSNYMELTSRTCSGETNISAKDSQASNSKLIEEDYDMNYKSLVSNKTQHFTSNYMELTSRTCSGETNISAKDSQASSGKLIEEDYDMNYKSLASNKTQHFTSDYMELTSRTCSGETNLNTNLNRITKGNEDPGFCLQKTKYFSSYGMDLTCDLQNENDSLIELVLNSPSDSTYNNECTHNIDNKSGSNVANANKYIGSQNYENCKFENEQRSIRNSFTSTNLATVVADKKSDSNSDSPKKSHSSCSKQDIIAIEGVKTDFHAQNLDVLPMNNSNKGLKSFKRGNISDNDHEFEPDNKVAKFSNFIEPGIVYAIKQVKGVNQASPNDYNVFKFPEVFFPLKKNLKPKTSFSCSRIQLTKAVQEAIRKSCSFSYAPKKWSPEFSERDTTFKNKLSKSPIKINEKSTTQSVKSSMFPDVQCTPMHGTWSRTKTIKETVHVYPDIIITENSPLPKTNISINKDGSLSISNISPDTMNYLRKSLNFGDEINSPRIIFSHIREESIVENTAVVTTAIEDTFPDSSKFCLDSSISLVPNDDTFSSLSLKLNSETVKELNSTNCLNPSFDQLKTIPLRDVDALSSPNGIKTFTPTNSILKKCVIQEEVTERREFEDDVFEDNVTQSAFTQCYGNNQDCLPHRNSVTLLKQKNINKSIEFSKIVPNEEIENSDRECNTKSSYLLSNKNDHVLKENQKTSTLKEFVKAQIKEPQESSKKHKQTPNKGLEHTPSKGSEQTPNKGSEQTPNKGSEQTSNKGSEQTPNKGSEQTPNKGSEQTPNKESEQTPNKGSEQTPNKGSEQTPNKGSEQTPNKGSEQTPNKGSEQTPNKGSEQTPNKGSEQTPNKGSEQTLNKGSVQSSSAGSRKQIIASPISSKSPTKLNKNEVTSIKFPINSKENCSNITAEVDIIDKNSKINDVNVEDAATLQDNLEQNNSIKDEVDILLPLFKKPEKYQADWKKCPENPFERIHSLRKKIIQASESEDCLWCLKEMDEKQAVFEILGDSLFACYLMCVDLEFTSEVAFCTQIAFMHLKEEPDDIDELGFSLFQSLVTNDIKVVPFPADELLNKMAKFVGFASSAKCLIKDVWFIAIKNEISIEDSSKRPKLNIKILNENHFSYFNVSLPISLTSYPDEKIIPEVTHIEHNVIKNEIIIDAIKKVHPGKKYLFRISEAANTV